MPIPFSLIRVLARSGLARWWPRVRRRLGGSAAWLHLAGDRALSLPLDDLMRFAEFWQVEGADGIDLAAPAPQFDRGLSPQRLSAGIRTHPPLDGLPTLRQAVAEHIGTSIDPVDEITITAGATAAFHRVVDTFVNPGDRVVLLDPCSPMFPLSLRARRARIRWLPTTCDAGRTRFPIELLRKTLPGAKLVVLANPNNPTGGVLTAEELDALSWWSQKFDVLIYCDESFSGFGDALPRPAVLNSGTARRRTLRAGSLGVQGGAAGARVGWLAGDRDLLRLVRATAAVSQPFVDAASQNWALAMLRNRAEFESLRNAFARKRDYAVDRLRHAGFEPSPALSGYFLWLPVDRFEMTGRQFAERLLQKRQVAVTPGDVFSPSGEYAVRISLAVDDGRLREGLARLAAFIESGNYSARPAPSELAAAV